MEKDNAQKEYEIVCDNIRHYGNMRFANLTVFLALTFGISVIAFGLQGQTPELWLQILARSAGIIISMLFWTFEYRTNINIDHFQDRARQLEELLEYKLWRTLPISRLLHADKSISMLFISIAIFWAFSLYKLF